MKYNQFIISGYVNGQKFRPSNWSERLCETGATFDPLKRVMRYSEHFYPRQCTEYGCSVYVNVEALDAELVRYISWFIESNSLEVVSLQQPVVKPIAVEMAVTRPETAIIARFSPLPKVRFRKAQVAA